MNRSSNRSIVVVGGSYAGVSTAHYLLKHSIADILDECAYEVILVSASSKTFCRPACPRAMISDSMFDQNKLFVNIVEQFEQYDSNKFRFIHGRAIGLDTATQSLTVSVVDNSNVVIDYYALVIATGATATSPLHGLRADASDLQNHWQIFREALPMAQTVVIAGGGPTGVETAGELGEYLNGCAGWFTPRLEKPKIAITLICSGTKLLPQLRDALGQQAERYLARVGVSVIKNVKVQTVSPEGAGISTTELVAPVVVTLSNGQRLESDLFIPAYGTRPNTGFIPHTLLAPDGRIQTDPNTLRINNAGPRVYALGDASSAAHPAIHAILEQVPVLCKNVRRDLMLDSAVSLQPPDNDSCFAEDIRETQLVPVGRSKGVGAIMGWRVPSFLVWLVKGRDYWLWTTGRLWSGDQWA